MTALGQKLDTNRFTWNDYCSWPESEHWELIGGEAFAMSPSPTVDHQDISMSLGVELVTHFKDKKCRVYPAPMDVKLSDADVVQPDLLVVCNPSQIKQHIEGPPSMVVEITSPSSIAHDRMRKTALYARYGVKEYWIVTPYPCMVEVYLLQNERYLLWNTFGSGDTLKSPSFPDLSIDLQAIFSFVIEQHTTKTPDNPPKPPPSRQTEM